MVVCGRAANLKKKGLRPDKDSALKIYAYYKELTKHEMPVPFRTFEVLICV
jgi:hypothetical protein